MAPLVLASHGSQDFKPPSKEAIRYGELVGAVYSSINMDADDPFYCYPLLKKSELMSKVGLQHMNGYNITRYLYANDNFKFFSFFNLKNVNWFGFVAESNDELTRSLGRRDIVVAIRGTITLKEWGKDFACLTTPFGYVPESGRVHQGFLSLYSATNQSADPEHEFGQKSLRDQIIDELNRLVDGKSSNQQPVRITVTGHSLGAALATLAACDIGFNIGKSKGTEVFSFTFGCPRVGDHDFKEAIDKYVTQFFRFTNEHDIVPTVPLPIGYTHVGTHIGVEYSASPYLKSISEDLWTTLKTIFWNTIKGQSLLADLGERVLSFLSNWHSLELSMHGIAAESFTLETPPQHLLGRTALYKRSKPVNLDSLATELEALVDRQDKVTERSFRKSSLALDRRGRLVSFVQVEDSPNRDERVSTVKEVLKYLRDHFFDGNEEPVQEYTEGLMSGIRNSDQEEPPRKRLLLSFAAEDGRWNSRDFTLLNKTNDVIKADCKIPACWWNVYMNKDMKQDGEGNWKPRSTRPEEDPVPTNGEYN